MSKKLSEVFSQNLSSLMAIRKITNIQMSKHLGVTRAQVSNWKTGNSLPRLDKFDEIRKYLKTSADYLLEDHKI